MSATAIIFSGGKGDAATPVRDLKIGGLNSARRLTHAAHAAGCAQAFIAADVLQSMAPAALERTFLAVNSPPVRLPPGSLVRISGWVRLPEDVKATADGVMLYDSVAGEGLAVRLTDRTGWKAFHLYRRVPPSGAVSVTMAMTGIGTAYFDDIRIEPLKSTDANTRGSDPFAAGR